MFLEVRLLSRGGQGGVSAAKILAQAAAYQNFEVQAIPKYGAERKGAPLFVDVRLSDKPIRRHAPVVLTDADHFIILEPTLLNKLPKSFPKEVLLVINNHEIPENLPENTKTGIVDAYTIAKETGLIRSGTLLVSTVMLGAWVKATGLVTLENLEKAITKMFKGELAKQNIEAVRKAYDQFNFVEKELTH